MLMMMLGTGKGGSLLGDIPRGDRKRERLGVNEQDSTLSLNFHLLAPPHPRPPLPNLGAINNINENMSAFLCFLSEEPILLFYPSCYCWTSHGKVLLEIFLDNRLDLSKRVGCVAWF